MGFKRKDDDKRMRKSRRRLVILGTLVVFFLGIQVLNSSINFSGSVKENEDLVDNELVEETKDFENLKTSISYGENSFSDVGDPQNVSLFHSLNQTFVNNRTSDGGITVEDKTGLGWNMTGFDLNFTDLYTSEKNVEFFTRNDGADKFEQGINTWYATSFQIPNTCKLRNISLFVQYWGGDQKETQNMSFDITIFNAKLEGERLLPDSDISGSGDQKTIDLTNADISIPASWYQANFSNRVLNISKTNRNTFFAVFQLKSWGINKPRDAYYYYSNERESDEYNSTFLKSIDDGSSFTELSGKNGMLKVNLAPINETPAPPEINLTVFSDSVQKNGVYTNENFFQNIENQFDIPISSPWFADVKFNVSFSGDFRFNAISSNNFNATEGEDVLWNSSLEIKHYPAKGYDYKARFYKPSYWDYNNTYNETLIFNDNYVNPNSRYIEILNSSNNRWTIFYNQSNIIHDSQIQASSNQQLWYDLDNVANITDYLNVSFVSNNSYGTAWLRVNSCGNSKVFTESLSPTKKYFDPWRIDQNTTIMKNNTQIQLNIMTHNGTMAGIKTHNIKTVISQMKVACLSKSDTILKNNPYYFNFSVKNEYNSENVSIDTLSIKYEKTSGEWVNLVKDYHYNLYSNQQDGIYNVTINTELSEFLAGTHRINFTFSDGNKYFFNKLNSSEMILEKRNLTMNILSSTYENRTYILGSNPNYTLYLTDSIEGNGIKDLDFNIYGNLSGDEAKESDTNYYTINDEGNGNYIITFDTESIFTDNDLQNLTITFEAGKEGIYNLINETDKLLIHHNAFHSTNVTIIDYSSIEVVFGQSLWFSLEFKDITNDPSTGLSDGDFILKQEDEEISDNYYQIEDFNDGLYNITLEMTPFNFEQINLTIFADHPDNKSIGTATIAYLSSSVEFNFTYSKATFNVDHDENNEMYVNDTDSILSLEITSEAGYIETADFDVSLGPNTLSVASLGKGSFRIYMDSTNLSIGKEYKFNLNIQKTGFESYSDSFNITITPYDAEIQIPENFQDMRVYQQQTIRMISILSNTFTEREILDAQVKMSINGTNIFSNNFTQLANKNGWYEGTLNVGDVSPGNHSLIIEVNAENYTPKNASTSVFILERAETSLKITEEFKKVYIWGDVLAIPVSLTSNNNPMSNTTITFQITETFTGGELSTESFILSTNEEGIARFEHVIPEGVQNIEILISFGGTNSLRPIEVSVTDLSFRSPAQQTFLNILPFIPLMIGGIVGVSGFTIYKIIQRRKKVEKWKEKAQTYKDAQNVRFMLILDKMSGQPIIQQDFGETGYDGSLIGGLLQAMTNFLHGLQKKEPGAGDKTSMLFDYKENEILIQDGEFSRGVLMLNEVPSEETKKSLTKFVQHFEERYEEHLQPFKGNLRVFDGYRELLDNYCKTHLLRQFNVSRESPEKELDAFHEKVLSISKTFELISRKNFDLNSLIDYVKSKVEDVLEERIIAVIIDLINEGFLEPIPKEKGDNLK